ncbi:MAG TPA: hypothetical protein GXZ96_04170 [Firmicutes bacterium]|nr:hypothetical protein [Bacillota bacterium]
MKIAIPARSGDLDALTDDRFGRAPWFVIVAGKGEKVVALENEAADSATGAGIGTAQLLVDHGVEAVVVKELGPKAERTLAAAGLAVYRGLAATVRETYASWQSGGLAEGTCPEPTDVVVPADGWVAVATEDGQVAEHFGRCPTYTLARVAKGRVREQKEIANPGHQPGFLPRYLGEMGISCIVAGGMGPRAADLFAERGIVAVTGVTGPVADALRAFADGTLRPGDASFCNHDHPAHDGCH